MVGTIAKRRKYGRIYYEVDGDTSKHHLSASNYGPESEWVLLTHPCSVTIISEMVCVR